MTTIIAAFLKTCGDCFAKHLEKVSSENIASTRPLLRPIQAQAVCSCVSSGFSVVLSPH